MWSGDLPREATEGITKAGAEIEERWEPGFLVYGVPVGCDNYVTHMMNLKVEDIASSAARACDVLEGEPQSLWTILRLSIQQQFDYWLTLVHPTQVSRAAENVNNIIKKVLERVTGSNIPMSDDGNSYTAPLYVGGMNGRSFQSLVTQLPIKLGGLGIRDQLKLSPVAYVAGLEH